MRVEVTYVVDDAVKTDVFYCRNASTQLHPGGSAQVELVGGRDVRGRSVYTVQYTNAQRIKKSP